MIRESRWLRFVDEELNPHWPASPWLPPTIAAGFKLCAELDLDQLRAALQTIVREGSHFPPTPGELYKRVMDLSVDEPEWGQAWQEMMAAVEHFGSYAVLEEGRIVSAAWATGVVLSHQSGSGDSARLRLEHPFHVWSSPLVEELVRMIGWAELCTFDLEQVRTMEAQARNKFQALVERSRQDRAWAGIPASGLARLEATPGRRRLTSLSQVLKALPLQAEAQPEAER